MITTLLLTANMLMIPSTIDTFPLPVDSVALDRTELVALVQLLRDERGDHLRKIEILEDKVSMWTEATAACETTIESLDRLADISAVTCDARVELERSRPTGPPRWLRRMTNGAAFSVGVLTGRGVCD